MHRLFNGLIDILSRVLEGREATSSGIRATRLLILITAISFFSTLIIPPSGLEAKTFTDDLGRKVEIPESPHRIVSLAPNITEILFYLNLGDRLVGVTDFCDYPEEAAGKEHVGWIISPDVEKIISLEPDIVFATAEGNRADIIDILDRVNIKVYVLNPHKLEDILGEIISIGDVTGEGEPAVKKVKDLAMRIDAVREAAGSTAAVRVLYFVSLEPMISVGPGSFINDIIEIAGGENVLSNSPVRYPRIGMEEVISGDPEVIIAPYDLIKAVRSWKKRWAGISAVRRDRIYPIDPDIISRPGPRVADGLELMYRLIHGKEPE